MKSKKESLPVLLAVDPSVRSLGWTIVNMNEAVGNDYYDLDNQQLWMFGLVTMESVEHMKAELVRWRWKEAFDAIKTNCDLENIKPTHFACEWPTFFNSMVGKVAVSQDYTLGLASIVGYLTAAFEFDIEHVTLWTPEQWKHGAPKHVTRNQMRYYFGNCAEELVRTAADDVIDSIMIARFWLTLYDRKKFRFQNKPEGVASYATNKERFQDSSKYAKAVRD